MLVMVSSVHCLSNTFLSKQFQACLWDNHIVGTCALQGLSIDETGKQHYLDASVAYKRAVLNCIDYLSKFGYTKEQVLRNSLASLIHTIDICADCMIMISCRV